MPDHFCIVSDHAKLKFSFDRQNVSPVADSYNLPCCSHFYRILPNTLAYTQQVVYSMCVYSAQGIVAKVKDTAFWGTTLEANA